MMSTARLIGLMSDHEETGRPCTRALQKIGDATRARVLNVLSKGQMQTAEIARESCISYSTAAEILTRLRDAGLVNRGGLYRSKWKLAEPAVEQHRGRDWAV